MNNKWLSFLAGCSTGALVTLLFAPRSGRELRDTINEKVHEGYDAVSNKFDEGRRVINEQGGIRGVVEKGVEAGKKMTNRGFKAARETVEQAGDAINESIETAKSRLNESVEAGEDRYRNLKDREVSGM